MTDNYSYLNSSHHSAREEIVNLNKTIQSLLKKIDKLENENEDLKKINKSLNSKINLLVNDNNIVKNVKMDIQDYSEFTTNANANEDTLKEFFYLLVLCEKMKYLNLDHIWMLDSSHLYREVQNMDLAFYEWLPYIEKRLAKENEEYLIKKHRNERDAGVITRIK
jgi:hypothetical protein